MPSRPPRLRSPGPLRLVFIGAGGINRVHRELLALQPSLVRMAGVADPDPSRAAALAADFQAPVFAEDGAMLDTLEDAVDAVLVTTPHFLHTSAAADALRRRSP